MREIAFSKSSKNLISFFCIDGIIVEILGILRLFLRTGFTLEIQEITNPKKHGNILSANTMKSTSQKTTKDTKKVVVVNNNENMKPEFDNSQIERMNEKIEDNKDEKNNNESVENFTEKILF